MVGNASIMAHHDAELEGGVDHLIVIDFGTSQSPKSIRQRGNRCAPDALRLLRSAPGAYRGLSASGFALPWRTVRSTLFKPIRGRWILPSGVGIIGLNRLAQFVPGNDPLHSLAITCIALSGWARRRDISYPFMSYNPVILTT
jgi:hypothetical protein